MKRHPVVLLIEEHSKRAQHRVEPSSQSVNEDSTLTSSEAIEVEDTQGLAIGGGGDGDAY